MKICLWHLCSKPLTGSRTKYCSDSCKNKYHVTKTRKLLKIKAVNYKGGKCQQCGYSRCIQALDFHHINQNDKSFGLSSNGITRAWNLVQKELDKCILLCANCHRELHDDKYT